MQWRLILEDFLPKTQHIDRVENIVSDTISHLPAANIYRYKSSTMSDSHQANEIFAFYNDENTKVNFPLALPLVKREKNKALNQNK